MTVAVYISSTEAYAGKTAVCIGLGTRWQREGYTVGYFKPMSLAAERNEGMVADEDTRVIKRTLGLKEPLEQLCPVLVTRELMDRILRGQGGNLRENVLAAYNQVAQGKDIVIIEGPNHVAAGAILELSNLEAITLFQARGIVVVRYRNELSLDNMLATRATVGPAIVGTILNTIPAGQLEYVEQVVAPFCARRGVPVFASIPQDRLLMATTVRELARALDGEVLCAEPHCENLVESLMVGAMNVEAALRYFRRKANKAVITGGDRTDIQSAALETSTSCLILTGNMHPSPAILTRAEEQGVPVILVKQDTLSTIEIVESVFSRVRFHDREKILRFESILEERLDYDGLMTALGIPRA